MGHRAPEHAVQSLLHSTKRFMELEDKLLAALAPPALSARFLRGDQLVCDEIKVRAPACDDVKGLWGLRAAAECLRLRSA